VERDWLRGSQRGTVAEGKPIGCQSAFLRRERSSDKPIPFIQTLKFGFESRIAHKAENESFRLLYFRITTASTPLRIAALKLKTRQSG